MLLQRLAAQAAEGYQQTGRRDRRDDDEGRVAAGAGGDREEHEHRRAADLNGRLVYAADDALPTRRDTGDRLDVERGEAEHEPDTDQNDGWQHHGGVGPPPVGG